LISSGVPSFDCVIGNDLIVSYRTYIVFVIWKHHWNYLFLFLLPRRHLSKFVKIYMWFGVDINFSSNFAQLGFKITLQHIYTVFAPNCGCFYHITTLIFYSLVNLECILTHVAGGGIPVGTVVLVGKCMVSLNHLRFHSSIIRNFTQGQGTPYHIWPFVPLISHEATWKSVWKQRI
jgi:hypothetical protein